MSDEQWVDDHAVHAALSNLESQLEALAERVGEDHWSIVRGRAVRDAAALRVESADAKLTAKQHFDRVQNAVETASAAAVARIQEAEAGQEVSSIDPQLDEVVNAISGWPQVPATQEAKALRDATKHIEKEGRNVLERLGSRVSRVESALAEAESKSSEAVARVSEQLAGFKAEADATRDVVKQHEQTMSEALKSLQERYERAEDAREAAATAVLEDLARMQGEAKDIVGVIGRTGMTGGYIEFEKEEIGGATRWRIVAVVLGAVAALVLAGAFAADVADETAAGADFAWESVPLTGVLLGLATYAARQAARHRSNATHARELALQLSSLPAYLEALPAEDRRGVLLDLAYVYFMPGGRQDGEDDMIAPAHIQEFVRRIRKPDGS